MGTPESTYTRFYMALRFDFVTVEEKEDLDPREFTEVANITQWRRQRTQAKSCTWVPHLLSPSVLCRFYRVFALNLI